MVLSEPFSIEFLPKYVVLSVHGPITYFDEIYTRIVFTNNSVFRKNLLVLMFPDKNLESKRERVCILTRKINVEDSDMKGRLLEQNKIILHVAIRINF